MRISKEAVQPRPVGFGYPFDRILIPLDGSGLAEGAFSQIQALGHRHPIEVILARIIEPQVPAPSPSPVQESAQVAQLYLKKAAAAIEGPAVQAKKTIVRVGPAAESLLAIADEEGVTLIIMSTHGRLTPSALPFGQVAGRILRSSRIPVLAVPVHPEAEGSQVPVRPGAPFHTMLVVSRPGEPAQGVVPMAVDLAIFTGIDLAILLRLVPTGWTGRQEAERLVEGEEHLRRLARPFESVRIPTVQLVEAGDPARAILSVADRRQADVIAMSTSDLPGTAAAAVDGVAEGVFRESALPVFMGGPPLSTTVSGLGPERPKS
jgi:nucleotide-binding universal stress UspA family protein